MHTLKTHMDNLKELFPAANSEVLQVITHGRHLFERAGITTDVRFRMFLAQMGHESNGFKSLKELPYSAQSFEEKYGHQTKVGKILGNNKLGDGSKYYGRGIIQLTGKWNYTFYGALINEDLVGHPDLAAQPFIAFKVALAYWKQRHLNRTADVMGVRATTYRINGGVNGLKDRQRRYDDLEGIRMIDYVK